MMSGKAKGRGSRAWVIILCCILFSMVSLPGVFGGYITIDRYHYQSGDEVHFLANTTNTSRIDIYAGDKVFRLFGSPIGEQVFLPSADGVYRIVLTSESGVIEDALEFTVGHILQSTGAIALEKEEFVVGEEVQIVITAGNPYTLTVSSSSDFWFYRPEDGGAAVFVPPRVGNYQVTFNDLVTGHEEARQFRVVGQKGHHLVNDSFAGRAPIVSTPGLSGEIGIAFSDAGAMQKSLAFDYQSGNIIQVQSRQQVDIEQLIQGNQYDLFLYGEGFSIDVHNVTFAEGLRLTVENISSGLIPLKDVRAGLALDFSNISYAGGTLKKIAQGNALYRCADFDMSSLTCPGKWELVKRIIPGEEYSAQYAGEGMIAFAEGLIEVLNVQSFPIVGGIWSVKFQTSGLADLVVTPFDNTSWWSEDDSYGDLEFLDISCDGNILPDQMVNGSIVVSDYSCEGIGEERSRVHTQGYHALLFEYGAASAVAYNDAKPWWNGSYAYRRIINFTNNNGTSLAQGYTLNISLDTQTLISEGKVNTDCSDVRFTWYNGTKNVELDRINITPCNDTNTVFFIKSRLPIWSWDANYTVYYGNPTAPAPPENKSNIYWLWDDFEDLTHNFTDGTVGATITANAKKNGNYGLQGDGNAGYKRAVKPETMARGLIIEGWVFSQGNGTTADLPGLELGMSSTTEANGFQAVLDWRSGTGSSSDMQIRRNFNSGSVIASSTANTVEKFKWYYIKFTWQADSFMRMEVWNASMVPWGNLTATDATYTTGYYGVGAYRNGWWDDVAVRLFTTSEPGANVSDEQANVLVVNLDAPENGATQTTSLIDFNCSASSNDPLVNITLYGDWNGWHANETVPLGGLSNSTNFSKNIPDGTWQWNCLAYDETDFSGTYPINYSFTVDVTPPSVSILSPVGNISDPTPLLNVTFGETVEEAWYAVDGGENVTLCSSCSSYQDFLDLAEGGYILDVYVNDSFGNVGNDQSSITLDLNHSFSDSYADESSIQLLNGTTWQAQNVSFRGIREDWWNSSYSYRMQVNITNTNADDISGDYTINFTINTTDLIDRTRLQTDCDDLRIVELEGEQSIELDRIVLDCANGSTEVRFRLRNPIQAGVTNASYYIYLANPSAQSPPNDTSKVYLLYEDFDDGTADGWIAHNGIWVVDSNAYYQSDNLATYMRASYSNSSWGNYSVDVMINILSGGATGGFAGVLFRWQNETDHYASILDDRVDPDDSIWFRQWIAGSYTTSPQEYTDVTVNRDVWSPLRIKVFDDAGQDTIRAIFDGITHEYNYTAWSSGGIGLMMHGTQAYYDNVTVREFLGKEPAISLGSEEFRAAGDAGHLISRAVNASGEIAVFKNITWQEAGTDSANNISLQVSADGGASYCTAQNGQRLDMKSCPGFIAGQSMVYDALFVTNDSRVISLTSVAFAWSEDGSPPQVSVASPNMSGLYNGEFLVNASINDSGTGVSSAKFVVLNGTGDVVDQDVLSLSSGNTSEGYWSLTYDPVLLEDGTYNISLNASDGEDNFNDSVLVEISIDTASPTIGQKELNTSGPADRNESVCINVSGIGDENGIASVTADVNLSNGSEKNILLDDTSVCAGILGDGVYGLVLEVGNTVGTFTFVNVTVSDPAGNSAYNATPQNLTVIETAAPVIALTEPQNNTGNADGMISFRYAVSDESEIGNCSLVINSTVNATNVTIDQAQNQSFFHVVDEPARIQWKIRCADVYGNLQETGERVLDVILFGGLNGTNMSGVDPENIVNLTIEMPSYGRILFTEPVNLSGGADLGAVITIANNSISVNSSEEPRLNKTAILSIYGLDYTKTPVVLKDSLPCLPVQCAINTYAGGIISFNVTSFSSYVTGANADLGIWDSTDSEEGSQTKYVLEQVGFFVNYSNKTSSVPITGVGISCMLTVDSSTINMTYNSTSKLYEFSRSFIYTGEYTWNVTCNGSSQGYEALSTPDTVTITSLDQWWNKNWSRCMNIEIKNNGLVALIDFPVYLNVSSTANMNADYSDLRFVNTTCDNGGSALDYEIEYKTAIAAEVWVEIDMLPANGKVIAMYYDNPAASPGEDAEGTWNSNFGIVYHMNASGNDSTANNLDRVSDIGTPGAKNTYIGYGRSFDGTSAWNMTDMAYWEQQWSVRTHEALFATGNDVTTRQTLFAEGGASNGVMLYIDAGQLYARWWSESQGWAGDHINTPISANTVYHAVLTYSYPGNYSLIVNGNQVDARVAAALMNAHTGNGGIAYTGSDTKDYHDSTTQAGNYFIGTIHEFRVMDTAESIDWYNMTAQILLNYSAAVIMGSEINHVPVVENATFNASLIEGNDPVMLNVTVTDLFGNDTVSSVNATFTYPNGTKVNASLTQLLENLTYDTPDRESGEQQAYARVYGSTNARAETGFIILTSLSDTVTLQNTYNRSKAFIIRRYAMANNDSNNEPDGATANIEWANCTGDVCNQLTATRYASTGKEDLLASYSILQADNIQAWNFTISWASGQTAATFDPDPDLPAGFADSCLVNVHRSTSINSNDINDFAEAEVESNITAADNIDFYRDPETAPAAAGTTVADVLCFRDASVVQQLFTVMPDAEPATQDVSMSPVNTSISFAIHNHRQADDGVGQNAIINNITNATNIQFYVAETGLTGVQSQVTAYVANFENDSQASTQHFRISPAYTDQNITSAFSPSASSLNRTLLTCDNSMEAGGGTAHTRDYWGYMLDSTSTIRAVNFRTRSSTQPSLINCWIITWPNTSSVIFENMTDAATAWITYDDIDTTVLASINNITVKVTVSSYNKSGSLMSGNDNPDLEVALATIDQGGWVTIGNISATGAGTFSATTTDSAILTAWLTSANRDVRIRGAGMDYYDETNIDEINWTGLVIEISHESRSSLWQAEWTDTYQLGLYNVTDIYAMDNISQANHSTYTNLTFTAVATPLSSFNLSSPVNASESQNLLPNLTWDATSGKNFLNYTIQLDKDPLFGSPDYTYKTSPIGNTSYKVDYALDANARYYWRVNAYNLYGNSTSSISVFQYIIDTIAPSVTLNSPPHRTITNNASITFTYTPADTNTLSSCTLYGNFSGLFLANSTNTTILNNTVNNFTITVPEGIFDWNAQCNDTAGNSNFASGNYTLTADTSGPAIGIISPANNTLENTTNNINFTANANDTYANISSCKLIIDGVVEMTKTGIQEGDPFTFTRFVLNGNHTWMVNCTDSLGNENSSEISNLSVLVIDNDPPLITLHHPGQDGFENSLDVNFNFTPEDATGIANCSIHIDGLLNQTNTSVETFIANNFTVAGLAEGTHNWSISCYDNGTDFNLGSSGWRNFTVDVTYPSLDVAGPPNDTFSLSSMVNFTYVANDTHLYQCTLLANFSGVYAENMTDAPQSNASSNFTLFLPDGNYLWNIKCNDTAGNTKYGDYNRTVKVDTTAPAYSNNVTSPASPATFNATQLYEFNITWTDSFGVAAVLLEHNFTGTLMNESVAGSGSIYSFTVQGLSAGSYIYTWYANDTVSHTNSTPNYAYTVNRAQANISLYLNGTEGNLTANEDQDVNMTVVSNLPQGGFVHLYLNGTEIQNGSSPIENITFFSNPGTYNITAFFNTTQNYTGQVVTHFLQVNDTTGPNLTMYFPEANGTVGTALVTFSYKVADASAVTNCSLYINGSLNTTDTEIMTDATQTFSVPFEDGSYSWQVRCYDIPGNLGASGIRDFVVNIIPFLNVSVNTSLPEYERGDTLIVRVMANDTYGNPVVSDATVSVIFTNNSITQVPWWNASYPYRFPINITNNNASILEEGYTVLIALNTTNPEMQPDGDDIRIVFFNESNQTNIELDRVNTTAFNTTQTDLWFRLQEGISENNHTSMYYVYFGNGTVTSPPANQSNIYFFYEDFEEGNISDWTNYSLGQVGLALAGGSYVGRKDTNNDPNGGYALFTKNITGYVALYRFNRPNEAGGEQSRYAISDSGFNGYGFQITDVNPSGTFGIEERSGGTSAGNVATTATSYFFLNTWYVIEQTWNNTQINITVYNDTDRTYLDSLQGTDPSVVQFDRFVIHGGYQFDTDDIRIRILIENEPIAGILPQETLLGLKAGLTDALNGTLITNFSMLGWPVGNYSAVAFAQASGFNTGKGYAAFNLNPDSTTPNITLVSPHDLYAQGEDLVNFTYAPHDINLLSCALYLGKDGGFSKNQTDSSPVNGANNTFADIFMVSGVYAWNVNCSDTDGNWGFAPANFTLNITGPDFTMDTSDIFFGNESVVEGNNITIFANISNAGLTNATSEFNVSFYLGNPSQGGTLIDSNQTVGILASGEWAVVNVSHILIPGKNEIWVMIDPGQEVNETDEQNNNASYNLSVSLYQLYYGNVTKNIILGFGVNDSLLGFTNASVNENSFLFVADIDSSFSFSGLQAIGRSTNNLTVGNDFTDIDAGLASAGFNDSVKLVWGNGTDVPVATRAFNFSSGDISDVPIVNSTNTSAFVSGILWDTADDTSVNLQYDDSDEEDLVFVTELSLGGAGMYGVYDYEIKVPALLRAYKAGTDAFAIYVELT
ncbi:MAG: Ig-like domain-containing protein [Nanoarchaeota archaeon]